VHKHAREINESKGREQNNFIQDILEQWKQGLEQHSGARSWKAVEPNFSNAHPGFELDLSAAASSSMRRLVFIKSYEYQCSAFN
jgi:hypothetical protein